MTPTLKTRIVGIVRDKLRLLTLLTLIGTVAAFLGAFHWTLELTSHFRVQYLAVSVICWLGLLVFRSWRWSFVGLLLRTTEWRRHPAVVCRPPAGACGC